MDLCDSLDDVGDSITKVTPHLLTIAGGRGNTAERIAERAYHYTDLETAARIEKSQLGLPGRTNYLTPNGTLSPLQAQIELALPQKNTGQALFEVRLDNLDPSRTIRQQRVTGNVYNRGGGGLEILYDGTIPLEHVRRIR